MARGSLVWVTRRSPARLRFTENLTDGNSHEASSAGLLLKTMGLKVTAIKIDPYLNIDAGMDISFYL